MNLYDAIQFCPSSNFLLDSNFSLKAGMFVWGLSNQGNWRSSVSPCQPLKQTL